MSGLSTTGSISFGIAFVAGRNRVPSPATGSTALRTRFGFPVIVKFLCEIAAECAGWAKSVRMQLLNLTRRSRNGESGGILYVTITNWWFDERPVRQSLENRKLEMKSRRKTDWTRGKN
jgi:hypothetical protein